MKKILLHTSSPALSNNVIFKTGDINNLNEPWIVLKNKLFKLGFDLITADNNSLDDCERILFIDSPFPVLKVTKVWVKKIIKILIGNKKPKLRDLYDECIKNGYQDKMILFLWEGKSVKPENYTKQLFDKFTIIFTWNDDLVDNKKFFKFYLPSPARKPVEPKTSFNKKKLLVNISANKLSHFPDELYSARRKTIEYFDENYPNDFDLYGPNWNKPISRIQKAFPILTKKYATFRGHANDKIGTMSKYKFSLCYENLKNENGYITEKILDCLVANTIPIYWGANNIEKYIDSQCFIDKRQFNSDKELAEYLINITEKKYNNYLEAIKKYLVSEKYKLFLPENFINIIINTLKL
jgi:hypothetical protein